MNVRAHRGMEKGALNNSGMVWKGGKGERDKTVIIAIKENDTNNTIVRNANEINNKCQSINSMSL